MPEKKEHYESNGYVKTDLDTPLNMAPVTLTPDPGEDAREEELTPMPSQGFEAFSRSSEGVGVDTPLNFLSDRGRKTEEESYNDLMNRRGEGFKQDAGSNTTWNSLPYKGPVYPIKTSDPEHLQPVLKKSVHFKQFCTWEEEDMAEYQKIWQQFSEGVSLLSEELKEYHEGHGWFIFLRWADMYYEAPAAAEDLINGEEQ